MTMRSSRSGRLIVPANRAAPAEVNERRQTQPRFDWPEMPGAARRGSANELILRLLADRCARGPMEARKRRSRDVIAGYWCDGLRVGGFALCRQWLFRGLQAAAYSAPGVDACCGWQGGARRFSSHVELDVADPGDNVEVAAEADDIGAQAVESFGSGSVALRDQLMR